MECEATFQQLKRSSSNCLCFSLPQDFILETDALAMGLEAVLSKYQKDRLPHPITYASHTLSPLESEYGITDLETLAVVLALSHFYYYLYGHKVKVITDHAAIKAIILLDSPNPSGRHAR